MGVGSDPPPPPLGGRGTLNFLHKHIMSKPEESLDITKTSDKRRRLHVAGPASHQVVLPFVLEKLDGHRKQVVVFVQIEERDRSAQLKEGSCRHSKGVCWVFVLP